MEIMNKTERAGDWMLTYTGLQFYPLDARIEDVCIEDIAHALANTCRFGGHCSGFYSVAKHSLLVARILPTELKLQGLLHDATEAYIGDMVRPLKSFMPDYREVEDKLWRVIAEKFGLPETLDKAVKHADNVILMTEKRDLLKPSIYSWGPELEVIVPAEFTITPDSPMNMARVFLAAFAALGGIVSPNIF
jgi:5'-nucleotidase